MRSKPRTRSQPSPSSRRARLPNSLFALTSADARFVIEPILADVLADVEEMSALQDPMEAELFGARLRSTLCGHWRARMEDPDDSIGRTLIRLTEGRVRADSLALLVTVAATWPEPVASHAQAAVTRIVQQGVALPVWADAVGRVMFVDAKLGEESTGQFQVLHVCFEHPGYRRHSFCVLFDRNLGRVLKNVFVTAHVDEVFPSGPTHPSFPGVTFRSVDALSAAALIGSGLEVMRSLSPEGREALGPNGDDQTIVNLLEARLRVLAPASSLDSSTTALPAS